MSLLDKNKKIGFSLALLLALTTSCATSNFQSSSQTDAQRSVASGTNGIYFPADSSFELTPGETYVHFMKTKVKPTLDKLSDKRNGGGGGFDNIGAVGFKKNSSSLDPKALSDYMGAKYDYKTKESRGGLSYAEIVSVFEALKTVKPHSTTDSISYYDKDDPSWAKKNDMAVAIKEAGVNSAPFNLATLYALTGGFGVKVKIDSKNYNYHVLYKTGRTNPHEEVMSGRSFAASPEHGAADATDPEYLRDLQKFLTTTKDTKPFYRALIKVLADSDTSGWADLSTTGQSVLSDFLTVYTAESDRHLMVNLKQGMHPWEIDLAAVTFVSAVSAKIGKVVVDGELVDGDLGKWFAPSKHNVEGGPHRSGIGITRKDRQKFQRAIHKFEMGTAAGKDVIKKIQAIVGTSYKNDVIQSVFDYLSNPSTPDSMGKNADKLADLMAQFIDIAATDGESIAGVVASVQ